MGTAQIVWTALPNGFRREGSTTTLQLSIFVSPRLRFDGGQQTGTLGEFRDFLDWPARLQSGGLSLSLIVDRDTAPPIPMRIVTKPQPDSALWKAVFDATTFVCAHELVVRRQPLGSYEASTLAETLYRGYGDIGQTTPYARADREALKRAFPHLHDALAPRGEPVAISPTDVESLTDSEVAAEHVAFGDNLLRHHPRFSFDDKLARAIEVAGRLARAAGTREAVPIVPRTDDPASAVAQFAAFHRRVASRLDAAGATAPDCGPEAKRIDFHGILSSLGEYRDLLRRLGLVIDLDVDAAQVAESLFGHAKRLRVAPSFVEAGAGGTPLTPWTRYVLDLRQTGGALPFAQFAAAPRGAEEPEGRSASPHDLEIVSGLLNLNLKSAEPPHSPQFDLVQIDLDGAMAKVLHALDAIVMEDQRPTHPIDRPDVAGAPAFRTSGVSIVRKGHGADLVRAMYRAEDHERALRSPDATCLFAEDLVRGYRIDVRRFHADAQFDAAEPTQPTDWLSLHHRLGTFTLRHAAPDPIVLENIPDEGFIQPAIVQDLAPAASGVDPFYTPESLFHWTGWSLSAPHPWTPIDLTPRKDAHAPGGPDGLPHVDVEFAAVNTGLPRLRFGHYYQFRARAVDLAGNSLTGAEANAVVRALEAQGSPAPVLSARPRTFRYRRFEPLSAPPLVRRGAITDGESIDTMVIRSNGSTTAAYAASLGDPRFTAKNERHIAPPKAALSTIESHGLLDGAIGSGGNPGAFYALCKRESGTLPEQHTDSELRVPYLPDPLARGAAVFGLPGVRNDKTGQLNEQGVLRWVPQKLAIAAWRVLGSVTEIDFGARAQWPDLRPFRLVLDEPASGVTPEPVWDPQTRTLTVRLAPGETRTVWISAYPQESDIDLFGLYAWCREQTLPSEDEKHFLRMAIHGALRLISPPRKVTLVHAVQQPVFAPRAVADNQFRTIRFAGDTVAYIAGGFNLHVNSTEKLDLLAQWEEPDPRGGPPQTFNTHVFEVRIPPLPPPANPEAPRPIATLDAFGRLDFLAPPEASTAPTTRYLARHEFGDTKHRKVKYRLSATTRFREYFPKGITSKAENLTRELPIGNVTVLSSARPAAPEITEIVPAFGWIVEGDAPNVTRSARRGGGLRVVLGPTWFSSGAGEQLAVVDVPRMSRWGLDPLRASPSTSVTSTVKPDVRPVSPPQSEFAGLIYPYDVQYDCERRLWYCDLTFRIGDAYFPFKELTLARYQPRSLPGLHLSPLVPAGIHQLASDRVVTLVPAPGHPDQRKLVITVSAIAIAGRAAPTASALADAPPSVDVTLEERPLSRRHWDADLGWTRASAAQQPVADRPPSRTELFKGHVLLPPTARSTQRRLVIREYEVFPSNPPNPAGQTWIGEEPTTARRLVYADTIPLA